MPKHLESWEDRYLIDPDTGCWNWLQSLSHGYAQLTITRNGRRKTYRAHRVAWERHHQQSIPPRAVIRHSCDNPRCVNHDHLQLSSQVGNVADMDNKNRRGKRGPQRQFTPTEIFKIRAYLAVGVPLIDEARRTGRTRQQIRRIRDRVAWPDI